jgi:hypothetical protein
MTQDLDENIKAALYVWEAPEPESDAIERILRSTSHAPRKSRAAYSFMGFGAMALSAAAAVFFMIAPIKQGVPQLNRQVTAVGNAKPSLTLVNTKPRESRDSLDESVLAGFSMNDEENGEDL